MQIKNIYNKIKQFVVNKKFLYVAIMIVCVLVGVGSYPAYNYIKKQIAIYNARLYNSGIINAVNNLYNTAQGGELKLRNFILDENGHIIVENGKIKQGEQILLKLSK